MKFGILNFAKQLFIDPGEQRSLFWSWYVNGLLASHLCPTRIRTLGLKMAGLQLDKTTLVRPKVIFRSKYCRFGAHTTINYGCIFDNRVMVRIGENVGIGINVKFITTNHDVNDETCRAGAGSLKEIAIGNGVFIGSGASILQGVTVGDGVVIAAGSMVVNDCKEHGLYVGVPAKLIRELPTKGNPIG